ncbi:TRAP transporter permease [Desulfoscipio geothermicus]|uniref:TRAP transporter, 4TM/12TM fusion protein n=1 Tax=Desulfoscipio geothermicus DSM 3669 TaxID=1121426 RepID=A0A1I6EEZ2_9FIRM|nr:TRAP transporter permease [Desulfoscipio geothermicus]SFR16088.1 TRAP transporter, 4TM/12TM fusion protein [Desulfoscipio geothermicus DSM 3669]
MVSNKDMRLDDLEKQQRELTGIYGKIVFVIGVVFGIYQLFILTIYPIDPWVFRAIHFAGAGVIAFLTYSTFKGSATARPTITDFVLAVLLLSSSVYVAFNYTEMLDRVGVAPTRWDLFFGAIALLGLLEITRRTTGWALPVLGVIFLGYAYLGNIFPGDLWHKGYSWDRIISYMFSMDGIYNIPLGVSANYVFIFILFGSFLEVSGCGKFFIDLAYSIAGRFRGGPAKVSVISSAMMGSVSGSAVANVASTGAFTIPLMKRVGYKPAFAGAVEAVASTGGQILPPVMGAGAFIMADITGISYSTIIIAAIIPALLYFLAVIFMVDFEAGKLGLMGLPKSELPNTKNILKERGILLIPLLVMLFSLLVLKNSPVRAAILSIGSLIVLSWFTKNKILFSQFFTSVSNAMKSMASIAATTACAGIIIGVFSLTGLGAKIAAFIIALSGGNLVIALVLVMLLCLLLGMGLPTVAAYALAASTVAPALVDMGVPLLAAHLFIFYYACISTITPPVCLSAFAGAAIAGAPPMRVGWLAMKLGITSFIIPFMFMMDKTLLLQGEPVNIFIDVFTALIGIIALSAGAEGFLVRKINWVSRTLFLVSAILLMAPKIWLSVPGLILFLILCYFNSINLTKGVCSQVKAVENSN